MCGSITSVVKVKNSDGLVWDRRHYYGKLSQRVSVS